MNYNEWKTSNTKKLIDFGALFGINKEDIKRQAICNNIDPDDLILVGFGIFIDKNTEPAFIELQNSIKEEKQRLFNDYGFMYGAFAYQLWNHEYCVTYDVTNALNSLDLTIDQVNSNTVLKSAFTAAKKDYQVKHEMY